MELDTATVLVVIASQLVQTGQLWLLNRGQRKLSRTLAPPPPAAAGTTRYDELKGYCINCGNLAVLRGGGVCATCLGMSRTDRPDG